MNYSVTTPPSTTRLSSNSEPYTDSNVSSYALCTKFSFPKVSSSVLIQFLRSAFPLATAGAIVSMLPKDEIPTVNPGLSFAHAITSVLSLNIPSPRPSYNAWNISEYCSYFTSSTSGCFSLNSSRSSFVVFSIYGFIK